MSQSLVAKIIVWEKTTIWHGCLFAFCVLPVKGYAKSVSQPSVAKKCQHCVAVNVPDWHVVAHISAIMSNFARRNQACKTSANKINKNSKMTAQEIIEKLLTKFTRHDLRTAVKYLSSQDTIKEFQDYMREHNAYHPDQQSMLNTLTTLEPDEAQLVLVLAREVFVGEKSLDDLLPEE